MERRNLSLHVSLVFIASMLIKISWTCSHGEVRLVNITARYEGNLKVCVAGKWSGVCTDGSNQEPIIACRQLGCGYGYLQNFRGSQYCPEHTFKFSCRGYKSKLIDCDILDSENCTVQQGYGSDVCIGVTCTSCSSGSQALLPYGTSVNDRTVPIALDVSSGLIRLQQQFPFFGTNESEIYVNTHGVLSFRSEYLVYTPQALPFNSSVPLILLFWMDTNIINGGNIYYRNVADMETLRQAHALLIHNYTSGFYPTSVFIATWSEVPPNAPGLERQNNTYQTVLMTDGETSYVCFIFEEIQWGGGAGVGFNAGDGNRSLTVPGALTSETLELGNHSNIGRPGVFIYRVDGNEIISPPVDMLILSPRFLSTNFLSSTSFQLNWVNAEEKVEHFNTYCYYRSCPYCSSLPTVERLQTTSINVIVSGLLPFTEYVCCVTASTLNGESACSEEINIRTQPLPPTEPRDITIIYVNDTSLILMWQEPTDTYGQAILSYAVQCSSYYTFTSVEVYSEASAQLSGLIPYTNSTCCVSARSSAGLGDPGCITVQTSEAEVCETTSVQIMCWVTAVGGDQTSTILILHPSYNYTVSIAATTVEIGPYSTLLQIQMPEDVPNGPPQNVHHIQLNDTLIGLIWEPPSIELQNGLIVGYNVTVSTSASNETTWKYNSTNTSLTFSLLTGSGGQTTYIFKIAARTKIGVGPYSTYEYITALTSHGTVTIAVSIMSGVVLVILTVVVTSIAICYYRKRKNNKLCLICLFSKQTTRNEANIYEDSGNSSTSTSLGHTQLRGSEIAAKTESTITKDKPQTKHGGDSSHKDETKSTDAGSKVAVTKQFTFSRPHGTQKPGHFGANREPQSFQLQKQPKLPPSQFPKQPKIPPSQVQKQPILPPSQLQKQPKLPPSHLQKQPKIPPSHLQKQPKIPTIRQYTDDPASMEDQPDIPESRYVVSTSLATHLSEDVPKFKQGIRGVSNNSPQTPLPSQNTEKIYQPLIPPKSYKENYQEPSSEYQSLAFNKIANNNQSKPTDHDRPQKESHHSEGQYQELTKREEASPYQPLTFGVATNTEITSRRMKKGQPVIKASHHSNSERQYQALTKREEINPYQPLTFGAATNTGGEKHRKNDQSGTRTSNHSKGQYDTPRKY